MYGPSQQVLETSNFQPSLLPLVFVCCLIVRTGSKEILSATPFTTENSCQFGCLGSY